LNTVKRRWPDLLIGLLVLLLLAGFAALLLGKNGPGRTQTGVVQSSDAGSQSSDQGQAAQTPSTQAPSSQTPTTQNQSAPDQSTQTPSQTTDTPGTAATSSGSTGSDSSSNIPTIPAAPVTSPAGSATTETQPTTQQPQSGDTPAQTTTPTTTTPTTTTAGPAPRSGGAVATSENRIPTRNDYRISLGSFADAAALQSTTAGVSKLGYTVYPIAVARGVVAQVGPFATREAAAQALGDIQRALPGALLYPPRNAPATSTTGSGTTGSGSSATSTPTTAPSTSSAETAPAASTPARTSTGTEPAASGPVYLQVGAYNSTTAAQTAVARVRDLGLEPSVNAPSGRLVTVVVGPFEGQALTAAEAKLQAGGIDSFRVR